ncbi:MAG: tRNA (N(6)-L-threonylcarbamoyladenosine(37)-C(2))-methylthiotransferase MtaB [Arenicellales bacterium]|nr:tRNA (N(6)-L-threonylcarbamoyladenosine(37)-C(2))-methylthiotransferase MtaB [Arenicellales bacterium]
MQNKRRVSVSTLGCKVNAFESELLTQKLVQSEWAVDDDTEAADLYIINTCTVTKEADRQARQVVRRAVRRNPDALVVVTGCYAQISPQACASIPGVDLVVGNDRKLDIARLLPNAKPDSGEAGVIVGDLDEHVSLPDQLLTGFEGQTRAFVQVQQGCNQGCTFCIIHRARGPSRSLLPTMVKKQVERLVVKGYKEIVICGVDLGAYGEDLVLEGNRGYGLVDLLEEICSLKHDFRIRLSSIDPAHIDERLITLMGHQPKICPHLHLSLQSGNSLILKRMKRRYGSDQVLSKVSELRENIADLVLSADIMVGFPTESEAHFEDTLRMVRQLEIAYPHVFPYSERPSTPAARVPSHKQVPVPERKSRAKTLRRVGSEVRQKVLHSRLGSGSRILVEGGPCPIAGHQKGRAGNYIEVWVPAEEWQVGQWADVHYRAVQGDALIGEWA